ncbi:MAG TPA: tRNA (N(6)-L-threonylcarbamoyladenosine(37)-C(2))-methylthiotransferase MtaB, partial [Terriglobia bacterium]
MTTFHLTSFGCRASQADGAALKRQLAEAGFVEAADFAESEVAVLNTCTVTATADAEVRQVIRRIHRQNPRCRIVVTGCYAQRAPQEIAALDGVAWVLGNSHKHRVAEVLKAGVLGAEVLPGPSSSLPDEPGTGSDDPGRAPGQVSGRVMVGEITSEFHFAPAFPDDRTRPTLKVQDGCDARCA